MKLLIASKKKTFFNIEDEFTQNNEDLLENFSYIFSKNHSSRFIQDSTEIRQIFEYHKKNISINLIGIENLEYTRLALDIAQEIGIPLQNQEYHLSFVQQAGRFSLFIKGENIFIDSSYNAGPESMKQVIENTKKIQKELFPQKEILYVL
jgi:UDP-N-acetylmuramyl pentapeptide synthase